MIEPMLWKLCWHSGALKIRHTTNKFGPKTVEGVIILLVLLLSYWSLDDVELLMRILIIQKGDKFKIKMYLVGLAASCLTHSSATIGLIRYSHKSSLKIIMLQLIYLWFHSLHSVEEHVSQSNVFSVLSYKMSGMDI